MRTLTVDGAARTPFSPLSDTNGRRQQVAPVKQPIKQSTQPTDALNAASAAIAAAAAVCQAQPVNPRNLMHFHDGHRIELLRQIGVRESLFRVRLCSHHRA